MAEQFKNLASTTLSGDIDNATTSVGVASAMGFTGGNFRILVDSEIMLVTGVSGTTFTVVRHQEGTCRQHAQQWRDGRPRPDGGCPGCPRPERPGRLRPLCQQAGCRRAGAHLPAQRWPVHRARQRLDLGEVRPDLAHDSPAILELPDLGKPGDIDLRGQQRGDLPGSADTAPTSNCVAGASLSHAALHRGHGLHYQCLPRWQCGHLRRPLHPGFRQREAPVLRGGQHTTCTSAATTTAATRRPVAE